MYCPLTEVELDTEVCPVKCIYRRGDGVCKHGELAYSDGMNLERISIVLMIPLEEVRKRATSGVKRIQTALAADAYIAYTCGDEPVCNVKGTKLPPVFRLLNFSPKDLRKILNQERYEKWRRMSKVDITWEDISQLFDQIQLQNLGA